MTVHQTNDHPSAPQGNQCLFSHFLASLGAQEIAHQCCDQLTAVKTGYPLTSITWPCRGLKCQPTGVEYFLKFSADKIPVSNDRIFSFFPMIHMKYLVFMSSWPRAMKIFISNWPRTRKFSQFLQIQAGKTFPYHGQALVTLYVQFLCSDWSKFDMRVHVDNLCSILKVVYLDSWSSCLFPLDVQNEIQLLSRVFCYSWLVCLLGFWLRNASLVKIR